MAVAVASRLAASSHPPPAETMAARAPDSMGPVIQYVGSNSGTGSSRNASVHSQARAFFHGGSLAPRSSRSQRRNFSGPAPVNARPDGNGPAYREVHAQGTRGQRDPRTEASELGKW